MKRGGFTDPGELAKDEAGENLQMLRDSENYILTKLDQIIEKRGELNDQKIASRNDPPAYKQAEEEDNRLRAQQDQLGVNLANLQNRIAEQQLILNPIARPPWEGSGKRKKTRKNIIGPLKKGELTSLGYSSSKKAKTRRQALSKAVDRYGPLTTLRKVNAIRVLTKRRAPKTSKTYKADVKYLRKKYF